MKKIVSGSHLAGLLTALAKLGSFSIPTPHPRGPYKPHQGARECLRRRIGGFHRLRREEAFIAAEAAAAEQAEREAYFVNRLREDLRREEARA